MGPPDSLGKHHRDINALKKDKLVKKKLQDEYTSEQEGAREQCAHLDFRAVFHVGVLGNGVGDDNGLEAGVVNSADSGTTEDSVGQDGVDFEGASLNELVGRVTDGAAGVGHVVDEDGHSVFHVTDEYHTRHFVGLFPFLVDESKVDVQSIGDRCYSAKGKFRH